MTESTAYDRTAFKRDLAVLRMTQRQFAARAGLATMTVNRWGMASGAPFPAWVPWLVRTELEKAQLQADLEVLRARVERVASEGTALRLATV